MIWITTSGYGDEPARPIRRRSAQGPPPTRSRTSVGDGTFDHVPALVRSPYDRPLLGTPPPPPGHTLRAGSLSSGDFGGFDDPLVARGAWAGSDQLAPGVRT